MCEYAFEYSIIIYVIITDDIVAGHTNVCKHYYMSTLHVFEVHEIENVNRRGAFALCTYLFIFHVFCVYILNSAEEMEDVLTKTTTALV
jgi:hypothetical protein